MLKGLIDRLTVRSKHGEKGTHVSSGLRGRSVGLRPILARYDAATTSDDNRRHWSNADGLSADAASNPEVRRTLRNRARYEVANNSYAKGIVLTLANDVVGTGPRLQIMTGSPDVDRRVEAAFAEWSCAVDLAGKLRTMRMARAESGECFLMLASNPRNDSPVQLDVRVIEADQVATPDLKFKDPSAVDGIVFDGFGNPIEYHLLRDHPGELRSLTNNVYDRIPADEMIHYFRADRPGQSRGIPDITPALPLFAQLRRYTLAVISAAETAAEISAIMKTNAPPNGDADEVEPMDMVELVRNMMLTLPAGWDMTQLRAEQPTTTYAEFKREILNEIARCLNMPFNVAAGNSSGYNYASGRLDHQTYFKSIRIEQSCIEKLVLDRILKQFRVEYDLATGDLIWPLVFRHRWFWDGVEHVDPLKEANAQAKKLESHTTSLAREYARSGLDWDAELRQIARENELKRELGIELVNVTNNGEIADKNEEGEEGEHGDEEEDE